MRQSEAHEKLWELVNMHFSNANVIFSGQSRIAKPPLPLVVIKPGKTERLKSPNYEIASFYETEEIYRARYQITEEIEINLFSKGKPVEEEGRIISYEDSANEEMLDFIDYLGTKSTEDWCSERELSLEVTGEISKETGVLNDSTYEYKAKIDCKFMYYEEATGHRNETGMLIDGNGEY